MSVEKVWWTNPVTVANYELWKEKEHSTRDKRWSLCERHRCKCYEEKYFDIQALLTEWHELFTMSDTVKKTEAFVHIDTLHYLRADDQTKVSLHIEAGLLRFPFHLYAPYDIDNLFGCVDKLKDSGIQISRRPATTRGVKATRGKSFN